MDFNKLVTWVEETGLVGYLKTDRLYFKVGYNNEDDFFWLTKHSISEEGEIEKQLVEVRNENKKKFIREAKEKFNLNESDKNKWRKAGVPGHGGKREGAGRKSEYNNLKTKLIRLPEDFEEELKEYGKKLAFGNLDNVTFSNDDLNMLLFHKDDIISILNDALKLKPNAGGKIKAEIRKVLEIIQSGE